jgi:hypothetical protein
LVLAQFLYVNCVFADDGETLYQEQLLHAHRSPFVANYHWQTVPDPNFGVEFLLFNFHASLVAPHARHRSHALSVFQLGKSCAEACLVSSWSILPQLHVAPKKFIRWRCRYMLMEWKMRGGNVSAVAMGQLYTKSLWSPRERLHAAPAGWLQFPADSNVSSLWQEFAAGLAKPCIWRMREVAEWLREPELRQ